MRTAIYPGTFDPITLGHIDVIKKSLKIFDKLIVATTENISKDYLFSIDERLDIIKKSLFKDLKLSKKKISVISFDTLTIDLCKKLKAKKTRSEIPCKRRCLTAPHLFSKAVW